MISSIIRNIVHQINEWELSTQPHYPFSFFKVVGAASAISSAPCGDIHCSQAPASASHTVRAHCSCNLYQFCPPPGCLFSCGLQTFFPWPRYSSCLHSALYLKLRQPMVTKSPDRYQLCIWEICSTTAHAIASPSKVMVLFHLSVATEEFLWRFKIFATSVISDHKCGLTACIIQFEFCKYPSHNIGFVSMYANSICHHDIRASLVSYVRLALLYWSCGL